MVRFFTTFYFGIENNAFKTINIAATNVV